MPIDQEKLNQVLADAQATQGGNLAQLIEMVGADVVIAVFKWLQASGMSPDEAYAANEADLTAMGDWIKQKQKELGGETPTNPLPSLEKP